MPDRPQKITFGEVRDLGVRGLLVYCADYRCSHSIAISGDPWPDDLRLSDIQHRFVCEVCGKLGADVRPDYMDRCLFVNETQAHERTVKRDHQAAQEVSTRVGDLALILSAGRRRRRPARRSSRDL
jgi:hypothetical protein